MTKEIKAKTVWFHELRRVWIHTTNDSARSVMKDNMERVHRDICALEQEQGRYTC